MVTMSAIHDAVNSCVHWDNINYAILMAATPIRQGTMNHSVYLDNIKYVIVNAPKPTKHNAVNQCVH